LKKTDFSWSLNTKTGKIYQRTTNYTKRPYITYTKWPLNIPNGRKIYQMAVKYTKWP
jgi:predicted secreted protein